MTDFWRAPFVIAKLVVRRTNASEEGKPSRLFACHLLFESHRTFVFRAWNISKSTRLQRKGTPPPRLGTLSEPPTTTMVATGAGWMHGIVKAVPSGDSVLIMGNTGQVRARARGDRRVDLGVSVERCVRSDRRPSDLSARDGSRACRLSSTDPDRVPQSPLAGWPAAGEDHHARLAHRPEDGASRSRRKAQSAFPIRVTSAAPRLPFPFFFFGIPKMSRNAKTRNKTKRPSLAADAKAKTKLPNITRVAATARLETSPSRSRRAKPSARV